MNKQLIDTIANEAPEMLERFSESEILSKVLELLTSREQQSLADMVIADWKGESDYGYL